MAGSCSPRPQLLHLLALALALRTSASTSISDAGFLLSFKSTLSGGAATALANWEAGVSPCKSNDSVWAGVLCTETGVVMGLQLENMSLSGQLRLNALAGLPGLRTLSFVNNSLEGSIPDLTKFRVLKSIYLSMNRLSGPIPDDAFAGMGSLKKLQLSQNRFTGPIPASVAGLPRLLELTLDGNSFTGSIPDLRQPGLKLVNVSNNDLDGAIPDGLSKMNVNCFTGNKGLCGAPLAKECNSASKKLSVAMVATIVAISVGVILLIIGAVLALLRRREEEMQFGRHPYELKNPPKKTAPAFREEKLGRPHSSKKVKVKVVEHGGPDDESIKQQQQAAKGHHEQQGKQLVFVNALKGDREKFELQDLMKASAEIMAGGSLGSCYKAALMNGSSVVVKRFREMNAVGKEEFQEHMSRLGRLSHPNLLPLLAYYYRREEKLLVTEYTPLGSLANLLHGPNRCMLDWRKRLNIVKGVGRGLLYLYESLRMQGLSHGHLKSSNVVLDESFQPLLTDYGLAPVMSQSHASQVLVAYNAPEIRQHGRTTKKSDVWTFGTLILEILTARPSNTHLKQSKGAMDLPGWVSSVVREEWTGEVFDSGMKGTKNAQGEMLKLLRIGLACCERDVDKRWGMSEALERIEELKERDGHDDEYYSSCVSDGYAYSSTAMSQDGFSLSSSKNYN